MQIQMTESQRMAEDAKREVDSYEAPLAKWQEKKLEDPEEAEQWLMHQCENPEHHNHMDESDGLKKKGMIAEPAHFSAKRELEVAEKVYNTARVDDFEEIVKRSALAQREGQSA